MPDDELVVGYGRRQCAERQLCVPKISHHAPDDKLVGHPVQLERSADRVLVAEELARRFLRHEQPIRLAEHDLRIARDDLETEDLEHAGIRDHDLPRERLLSVLQRAPERKETNGVFDLGKSRLERRSKGPHRAERVFRFRLAHPCRADDPVQPIDVRVERVVGGLDLHDEQQEQARRDGHGQAEDVDEGVALVLPKVAEGGGQVVTEHVEGCQLSGSVARKYQKASEV